MGNRRPDCHPDRKHQGRGLCPPCYDRHRRAGTLDQFSRVYRPWTETVTEAERLRAELGLTWAEIARRMGIKLTTLDNARNRYARTLYSYDAPRSDRGAWRSGSPVHGETEEALFLDEGEEAA